MAVPKYRPLCAAAGNSACQFHLGKSLLEDTEHLKRDYVQAMHLILQQPSADDYVVATGQTHSVREFCELAFAEAGLDYRDWVKTDPAVYRPAEVDLLVGDASKASAALGWRPTVDLVGLVKEMVASDLEIARREVANGKDPV